MAADGLSRAALERLAGQLPPGECATVEAEIALGRAALMKRHYDIVAAASRDAAHRARAAFGREEFDALFERAKALRRSSLSAHRAYARAKLRALRIAAGGGAR